MIFTNWFSTNWLGPVCRTPVCSILDVFSLSDIMDFRHQSSAMSIIMLEREVQPVVCNESREPYTNHYPSRPGTKRNNQHTTRIRNKLPKDNLPKNNLPKIDSGTLCRIIFGKLSFTFGKLSFGKMSRIQFLLLRSV